MPHSSTPETKHSQQPVKQVSETSHTEHQSHIKTEQHIEKLHSASKFISTRYISEEPLIQRPVVSESCDIKAPDQSCDTKSGLNLLQEIKQSSTEEERLSHKHKKKKKKHKHRNGKYYVKLITSVNTGTSSFDDQKGFLSLCTLFSVACLINMSFG